MGREVTLNTLNQASPGVLLDEFIYTEQHKSA